MPADRPAIAALALPVAARRAARCPEALRSAGRQALAAAARLQWAEADSFAAAADPLAAKLVLWMRLTNRAAPATARELVDFIAANPDWPYPDTLARRAETALATDLDDELALRHFRLHPARTLAGALRHAEALNRAGHRPEARAAIRRAWPVNRGDAVAEDAILAGFAMR